MTGAPLMATPVTGALTFRLPDWQGDGAAMQTNIAYDLLARRAVDALRDHVVAEALALLSDRLDLGAAPHPADAGEALADLRARMRGAKVPPGRAHADWHLQRAFAALAPGARAAAPQARMRHLDAVWRNLAAAARDDSALLIDLSQCCCGPALTAARRETPHGL